MHHKRSLESHVMGNLGRILDNIRSYPDMKTALDTGRRKVISAVLADSYSHEEAVQAGKWFEYSFQEEGNFYGKNRPESR